jgi:hypothetical protein
MSKKTLLWVAIAWIAGWVALVLYMKTDLPHPEQEKPAKEYTQERSTIERNNAADQKKESAIIERQTIYKTQIQHHYDTVFMHDNALAYDSLLRLHTALLRQYADTDWSKIDSGF